jgi:hypothetical protein
LQKKVINYFLKKVLPQELLLLITTLKISENVPKDSCHPSCNRKMKKEEDSFEPTNLT